MRVKVKHGGISDFGFKKRKAESENGMRRLDGEEGKMEGLWMRKHFPAGGAFTLVEILVVVAIIGLLAGLSIPAVGGALNSARKAKVNAMAHQVRTAIAQFNTEYGFFPTNDSGWSLQDGNGALIGTTTQMLMGDTNNTATLRQNPRAIAFLEVPMEFMLDGLTNNLSRNGLVTPKGLYRSGINKGKQVNLYFAVDTDYNGRIWVTNSAGSRQEIPGTVGVWFIDPGDNAGRKTIGTWR